LITSRLIGYKLISRGDLLDFLIYEICDRGRCYYKILKLLRLLKTFREIAQIKTLLDMHQGAISAFKHETNARLILLAVHSKKFGLIWCYEVAVFDRDLEKAKN